MKNLSEFKADVYVKNLDEEKMVKAILETVEENNLTEQETDELINELFGISSTLKTARAKAAHPFKLAHAAIKGAAARVKSKVADVVGKMKEKSAAMDKAASDKLLKTKQTQGKAVAATYKKASGGMERPTPVKTMSAADKQRLAATKASAKATPPKPKMSTGAATAKAKTGKPKAPQPTATLAKQKSKPTAKTEPTVLKNKAPKVNPNRLVTKKTSPIKKGKPVAM